MPRDERSEFEEKRILSAVHRGDMRTAERIAREGGGDERAVGLVARRVARAHGATLAADLRALNPEAKGPVTIVDLTLEELCRDGTEAPAPAPAGRPLASREDDEHAVNALGRAARHVTAAGETCRVDVTRHARFEYRARAEGMAARRRTRSRTSA